MLEYESTGSNFLQKPHALKKSGVRYCPKAPRPIKMQDYLNCNISQAILGMKMNFCMWPDIHRSPNLPIHFNWLRSGMPDSETASSQELVELKCWVFPCG